MSEPVYLLSLGLPLLALVLVFGMKYLSAAIAARARLDSDAAYSALAEKTAALQADTQASLAQMQAELSRASATLASVEKILKEVE